MQGSKTDNFVKSAKRSKSFDDGYSGRQGGKKNDFHRQSRSNGNKAGKYQKQD
jgi:hypothetical protein